MVTQEKCLKKIFKDFKELHFKSAGKLTRPNKTWRIMFDLILKNKSDLFHYQKLIKIYLIYIAESTKIFLGLVTSK